MSTAKLPTNSSGVKLPYFHRSLSEEDQKLIGDTAPKRIDQSLTPQSTQLTSEAASEPNSSSSSSSSAAASSAWNSGSTWEEKNVSKWARDYLMTQLIPNDTKATLKYGGKSYTLTVVKVETGSIESTATITYSRGKARFLYELAFSLEITISELNGKKYSARVRIEDAINDLLDDIILSVTWTSPKPPAPMEKVISEAPMKEYIIKRLQQEFEVEYRKLHRGGNMSTSAVANDVTASSPVSPANRRSVVTSASTSGAKEKNAVSAKSSKKKANKKDSNGNQWLVMAGAACSAVVVVCAVYYSVKKG